MESQFKYYKTLPTLRNYQQFVSNQIDEAEKKKVSSVICQPTGTGKSVVLIDRAIRWVEQGKTVAIIVPSVELVHNVSRYIQQFAPKLYDYLYSPICSKLKYRPGKKLYVATYGSFIKRYASMASKPTYFIHDEAHHCKSNTWEKIAKLPGFHLAFTATPLRLDGRSLSDLFPGFIDTGRDVRWFIDNSYLNNFEVKSTFEASFEVKPGIDNLGLQAEYLDTKEILGDAVNEYKLHALGRKTVVFCTSIEHCKHTADAYNAAGIPATVITSGMSFEARKAALDGFATGKYLVIINVAILTEGVDVPDAECIQLLRFTNSTSLYFQMVGRGLRKSPNKTIILDHAGNVQKHGTPDFPLDWRELYYAQVVISDPVNFNPYILCQCCEHPLMLKRERPQVKTTVKCPKCGYNNTLEPPKKRKEIQVVDGNLFSFDMSLSEQLIYRIIMSDKPHQTKVSRVLDTVKKGASIENVKAGLKYLYKGHPQVERMVQANLDRIKARGN